MMTKRRDHSF